MKKRKTTVGRTPLPAGVRGGSCVPKRLFTTKPTRRAVTAARKMVSLPPSSSSTAAEPFAPPKSKFFFDMLLAMDQDVMAEFVVPHLPPLRDSVAWLGTLMQHGRSGGLLQRDVVSDFLMPCFAKSQRSNAHIGPISATTLLHQLSPSKEPDAVFASVLHGLHVHAGASIMLDFQQCKECTSHFHGLRSIPTCLTKKMAPMHWDCLQRANAARAVCMVCTNVPITDLVLRNVDTTTPIGMHIMALSRDQALRRVGGCNFSDNKSFCSIDMRGVTLREATADKFATLVNLCMRNCRYVHMENFTFICPNTSSSRSRLASTQIVSNAMPAQLIQAVAPRWTATQPRVQSLVLKDVSFGHDSADVVKAIMRMHRLRHLALGSEHPPHDIAGNMMAAFDSHFLTNPSAKFDSLVSLRLTFGTMDTMSSNMITTDHEGTLHIDMMYTKVPPMSAHSLSEKFAPRLKHLALHCKDSPMATLKLLAFLGSLIQYRENSSGKPSICTISVTAKFMPFKLIKEDSDLRVKLRSVCETFTTQYTFPYMPGEPTAYGEILNI